ncbi:DUF3822 family protein [Lacinutrix neustonica]|uniref:DUF3822 family protein n=1 Tax=Lacinutrix neustonica TaxID=2980107 RepID=A0A9E8MXI6_9FLAO|nr:DUF3822 family protein [Lacinutrix neustonica]WAC02836.1 DUF3822 family protein [Lacinutrix neustonica]
MATGQNYMTQSKIETKIHHKELSIQVSLNGLSFCVLNTETKTISHLKTFLNSKKKNPLELLDQLKHVFNTETILHEVFNTVTVIHVNELSALVPKALFNKDIIADYLKLNTKILKTDFITYDTITLNDSVNVYVPYVNANNFIYDHFGDFTFKHYSTVLIESILRTEKHAIESKLYVHVNPSHFEIVAIKDGQLTLYNTFEYETPEDFIYYILFTIEQLSLNPRNH